jgi:hypothetical protein
MRRSSIWLYNLGARLMNKLVWGLIIGSTLFGSAANADTMEEAVGNTVVVELADGTVERYLFNADRTFSAELGDAEVSGTWSLKGTEVCIDVGDGEAICEDYPKGKKVGDSWTEVDDDDGTSLKISIKAGR